VCICNMYQNNETSIGSLHRVHQCYTNSRFFVVLITVFTFGQRDINACNVFLFI
jgi:hypothetical protein